MLLSEGLRDCSTFDSSTNLSSQDFTDAASRIFTSLEDLRDRYGIETILVVTRGSIKQPRFSRVHASGKASRFLRNVVRTDAGQLAEKLEGYIVSGAADHGGIPHSTVKMKQKEQIKIARDFILNGLIDLLREENIPEDQIPKSMNYKSYQTKIVDQCGAVLVGYPGDKGIVNPGELDALMLKELLCRLNDGRCYWRKAQDVSSNFHRTDARSHTLDSPSFPNLPIIVDNGNHPTPCSPPAEHCPPSPSSSETLSSSSWLASMSQTPSENGRTSENEGKLVAEHPSQVAPMSHYEPPPSYLTMDPSLWQTPDPVARAMQVLSRAYLDAFTSLFPHLPPPLSPAAGMQTLQNLSDLRSIFTVTPGDYPFPTYNNLHTTSTASEFQTQSNMYTNPPVPNGQALSPDSQAFTYNISDALTSSIGSFSMDLSSDQSTFGQLEQDSSDYTWLQDWSPN